MNVSKNTSFALAILTQKCPKCREGSLFKFSTYNIKKFSAMHDKCSICAQDFVIEPGFYTGAMYFSYAFNVAILLIVWPLSAILFDFHTYKLTAIIVGVSVLAMPLNFRYSRVLMIYLFAGINYKNK